MRLLEDNLEVCVAESMVVTCDYEDIRAIDIDIHFKTIYLTLPCFDKFSTGKYEDIETFLATAQVLLYKISQKFTTGD